MHRRELTQEVQAVFGVNGPVATVAALIHAESYWRGVAASGAGARGYAQFLDSTAADMNARYPDLAMLSRSSSTWQFRAAAIYLKELMAQVDAFDCLERTAYGLSAYNGGLRWVYKRQSLSHAPLFCLFLTCDINPGILPRNQVENERYSRRILLELEPLYRSWGRGACYP